MSEYVSIKETVLKKLEDNLSEIQERFGIETIGIFGSVSRGEDSPESDIDFLYRFQHPEAADIDDLFRLTQYLKEMFQREVEMISMDYVDPYILKNVKNDAILYGATEKGIA